MKHLLASTAVALVLGLAPALAADPQSGQLPTTPSVSPDAAKAAQQPQSGSADTSGGAAEQSSASPNSGAATGGAMNQSTDSSNGQADQSGGAKERSSAPLGSSAATGQPNPTLGQQNNPQSNTQTE
jgi:hypothetical protein